ncbi:hypothetical protein M8C21_003280 [Ambrosia artemisiifolia]|uniref:Uncharacterized protein n=1 Tax=Ambrosia artemisiifolia TaxID=4212 RepID=A0AAD5CAZ9_AMBAR|nr:hypothetical protein M8C21_003280 [Ambrosia artemisiifolia]
MVASSLSSIPDLCFQFSILDSPPLHYLLDISFSFASLLLSLRHLQSKILTLITVAGYLLAIDGNWYNVGWVCLVRLDFPCKCA